MSNFKVIKDKIRKLLALSKSNNENEAALALEKANILMEQYDLNESELYFEQVSIKTTKIVIPYRTVIANAVSWLYCCYTYSDPKKSLRIFAGGSLDVFLANEMYIYLIKAIDRCAKKEIRKNAKLKFKRDFKYGMADRIYDRIMILGESCSWAPRRDASIEEAKEIILQNNTISSIETKKYTVNRNALMKGLRYGDSVSLARQAGFRPAKQIAESGKVLVQKEWFK